jgi:PAS domain S-box-containing protein
MTEREAPDVLLVGDLLRAGNVTAALERMGARLVVRPRSAAALPVEGIDLVLVAVEGADAVACCVEARRWAPVRVVSIIEAEDLVLVRALADAGAADVLAPSWEPQAVEARLRLNLHALPPSDPLAAQRLAMALRGTRTGLWDWDLRTGTIVHNEEWAEMLGYTLTDLGSHTADAYFDRLHPDDAEPVREALRRCFAQEMDEYSREVRLRHSDGHWLWVLDRGRVVEWSPDGAPLRMIGTHVDVSALHAARVAAAERDALYRSAVHGAGEPIVLVDWTGAILDANDAACRHLGYAAEELLGLSLGDLEAQAREAGDATPQHGSFMDGVPGVFQTTQIRKDGSLVPVEVRVSATGFGSGGPFLGFIRDLTEQKRQEALLRAQMRLTEASTSRSSAELMRMLVDEAEALTASAIGFFHIVDADQESLLLQEWSTRTLASMCRAQPDRTHYPVAQAGVWAEAVRTRAPSVHNDFALVRDKKGFPHGHAHVARELVVPVVVESGVAALLGVGNKPTVYDDGDVRLLSTLAREGWQIVLRRQAEERARQASFRYQEVVDSSPDGFMAVTLEGRIAEANEAYAALTGYTVRELKGMHVWDLSERPREEVLAALTEARARGHLRFDSVHRRKDGSRLPLDVVVRFVELDGGRAWAFLRDATNLKRVLGTLQRSRDEYRALVENSPDLVLRANADGAVTFWNGRFPEIGDPLGGSTRGVFRVLGAAEDSLRELDEALLRGSAGRASRVEMDVGAADAPGTLDVRLVPELPGPDGRRSVLVLARDITEQRRTERALQDSEARFRGLFEHAPVGIFLLDPAGTNLAANPAFAATVRRAPADLVGRGWEDITHPADAGRFRDRVAAVLEGDRGDEELEVRYLTPSGEEVWVRVRVAPIRSADGRVAFLSVIAEDLTRERTEEGRRIELESRLRQAQKMEAIGTLAGGIAHDFNNILAAILGYAELLHEDADAGDVDLLRRDAGEVLRAGRRAKDLVSQILSFSRQGDLQPRPLRLTPVVKEALKLLRASIPTTIEIRSALQETPRTVMADATQFHQVVMNLCTNAFQAMRATGGTLDVDLRYRALDDEEAEVLPELRPVEHAVLTVNDDGPGMSADVLARVFEPYFTTKAAGEGTGLGLATVHAIVTSHGGAVRAMSAPGGGATFRVFLPVVADPAAEEVGSGSRPRPVGTERILFVDDEEAICRMAAEGLGRLGYRVRTVSDPRLALAAVEEDPDSLDAVITDLTMPGLTGLELCARLKAARPGLPVLLCSGYAEPDHRSAAEDLGAGAVLVKPLGAGEMAAVLRRLLDGGTT